VSISDWTTWFRSTLQGATPQTCATKLALEAVELAQDPEDLDEAADVLIVLASWCEFSGNSFEDLLDAADNKMLVNAGRDWERQPDGTYQHTKEPTP